MPPKTVKKIINTPGQSSIQAFFHKPAAAPAPISPLSEIQVPQSQQPSTPDKTILAFMESLTPSEHVAHGIAVKKLGTSYDITRTHGFVRWNQASRT